MRLAVNTMLVLAAIAAGALLVHHAQLERFFPLLFAGLAAAGAGAGAAGTAVGFNPGAGWSTGAMPTNAVSFFRDPDFKGPRRDFAAGAEQRSLSAGFLRVSGKENDTYSSVIVPPGLQVTIYKNNSFQGASAGPIKPGRYSSLAQFGLDNAVSSLKVSREGVPGGDAYVVRFYTDKNYGGKALNLGGEGGWPRLDVLTGIDSRDNAISSAIVSPGFKAVFYPEPDFGGAPGVFTAGSYAYVGDYWNDKISSVKVERA